MLCSCRQPENCMDRDSAVTNIKHYRSDAFAAIYEGMDALHQIGAIGKKTMREFDESCLTPVAEIPADSIKALRERE